MKYPLRNEYDTAIRNLDKFVFDNTLKVGVPAKQTTNPHLLRSYNGGKAVVYEIQTDAKKYALKCWVEDLGDLKIRYREIDTYLQKINIPYFVDFSYQENGILVNGQRYPIVRMEWVDGISFKSFISNNIASPHNIRDLADKFLKMMQVLHQHNISHGDLQHGNIMIRNDGEVCLIDYDGLYVPSLGNEKDTIKGLSGYQHPLRYKLINLSPKSDYFSELIIYISLLALSIKPSYWQVIGQEERLFFCEADLANPQSSNIFRELKVLSEEINFYATELEKFCKRTNVECLYPLEDLVAVYKGEKEALEISPIEVEDVTDPSSANQIQSKVISNIIASETNSLTNHNNVSRTNTALSETNSKPINSDIWDKLGTAEPKPYIEQYQKNLVVNQQQQPIFLQNGSRSNIKTKSRVFILNLTIIGFFGFIFLSLFILNQQPTPNNNPPAIVDNSVDNGISTLNDAKNEASSSGNLGKAIEIARGVPSTSSAYADAQSFVNSWSNDWDKQNELFSQVKNAYDNGRWSEATDIAYNQIPRNTYWDSNAELTFMAVEAKRKIAELNNSQIQASYECKCTDTVEYSDVVETIVSVNNLDGQRCNIVGTDPRSPYQYICKPR